MVVKKTDDETLYLLNRKNAWAVEGRKMGGGRE